MLIRTNAGWLRQAARVVESLTDEQFAAPPPGMAPHRCGAHLRHVLEFFECFLDGVDSACIDYDARRRDFAVENDRGAALRRIREILRRLEQAPALLQDRTVAVAVEDAAAHGMEAARLESSLGRELQVLSSHTIHHFALIALTLRAWGVHVDADFGMAPSTLRYQASRAA